MPWCMFSCQCPFIDFQEEVGVNNKRTIERIRTRIINLANFIKPLGLQIENVQTMKHREGKETNT